MLWLTRTPRTRALSRDDRRDLAAALAPPSSSKSPRPPPPRRPNKFDKLADRVAASAAAVIPPSNVGHQILSSLGWTGGRLGATRAGHGLVDPVGVVVRNGRGGLGG